MNTNASSISDSILIDQYLHGSEPALEKLISRHKARIYNFINSKVQDRDTAEDLFQDTFIKVIRTVKGGHYNEEGKFLLGLCVLRIILSSTILERVIECLE